MRKHHPQNERIKREYFSYVAKAKRMTEASIDQAAAAIAQFETSTNYRDFRKFHRAQAVAFCERLSGQENPDTGKPLAKATILSRVRALKAFVTWLAGQPGYRSRITYADADYFNISANDERIATATRPREAPSLDDVRAAIEAMPTATIVERRDRAIIAFALLSGARDNAIASFSLKHVDMERRTVFQDARDVRTKNAKTFLSVFFPVGSDFEAIVADWIAELLREGFRPDDPLFPATDVRPGPDRQFAVVGLTREHWSDASAIRRIFKEAFPRAGLPYYNPHSLRQTLARLGERLCRTAEEWKAYSQNFGHSSPMTTFNSYGNVAPHRQAEILNALAQGGDATDMRDQMAVRVVLDDDQMRLLMGQISAHAVGRLGGGGPKSLADNAGGPAGTNASGISR